MIQTLAFYFFSAVCLALFCIRGFSKNVLYALSALAGGMVFMSGFFFLLDAEFLGVVQIIVYTGAVIVLYGFALMFLGADKNVSEPKKGLSTAARPSACGICLGNGRVLLLR